MAAPPPLHEPIIAELVTPEIQQMLEHRRVGEARLALKGLLDAEIADIITALPAELGALAFRILPRDRAADVFPHFDHDFQEALVKALSDRQIGQIFDEMDPDDRVEFLEDADEDLVAALMAQMKPEEREETEKILEYPEESVGRLATPDYLTVRPDWTADQALQHIRVHGKEAETIHTLYVVDDAGRLLDHVTLRDIVTAPSTEICQALRRGQTVSLQATDDREQAVLTMERYDMPVLPVVDADGTLVGIVTFDDVADVAEEEATEDIHKLGGLEALNEPYRTAGMFELIRKRSVWLTVLFCGEVLTILAISRFQVQIEKVVALAFFMPLIIASGGNTGSQAATLIVRAMALGELTVGDWWMVVRRELLSGLVMGSWLGLVGLGIVCVFQLFQFDFNGYYLDLALTIPLALMMVVTVGSVLGSTLPIVLRLAGFDPATGSNPMVATLMDVTGLVIYFTLAVVILHL